MSVFGLVLVVAVALVTLMTGLPAYLVLLMGSVAGACVGVGMGAIDVDILRGVGPRLINLLESDLLQALPLFLLMGALLNRLPVTDALFKCGAALFGRSPAAPVLSGFLLGGLLGPMNGSVGASVGALARTLAPRLARSGVPTPLSEAVIAVAGTLGVVVPPSLVLILLGDSMLAAHTLAINATKRMDRVINTQDLMRGALLPAGLFLLVCLLIAAATAHRRSMTPAAGAAPITGPAAGARERPTAQEVVIAICSLAFLVALLGGVATGRFYAVEAAAAGAVVLFVWALFAGRLSGGALGRMVDQVLAGTGTLFAPLLAATTFTLVLRLLGTDKLVEAWVAALPGGAAVAVTVILASLALLAVALDAFEIIFVAVPILVPALLIRVDDAVWVGVLVLLVLQTSFLLPPMGYAWVLTRASVPVRAAARDTLRALLPFLCGQVAVLALVVCVPAIVHVLDPPGSRSRGPEPNVAPVDVDAMLRQLPPPAFGVPGSTSGPSFPSLPPPPSPPAER